MAHYVKCFYCGGRFDRDKDPFIKVSERRYAHVKCVEEQSEDNEILQQQKDRDNFYQIVKKIYGKDYNYILINQQANSFITTYNYTWSGMTKCLEWFYFIKHGSIEEGHGGIGIIPYIYDQVRDYYYKLYVAEIKNKNMTQVRQAVDFNIQSPRAWHQPPQLLDLEDNNENN